MRRFLNLLLFIIPAYLFSNDIPTLAIGSQAPDFSLKGVDGKKYSLKKFKSADVLVVVFTCNHCPTAQAYEERLVNTANEFKNKGVQFVAISPNDPKAVRLDELGYSDLGDSYQEMIIRHKNKPFPFPYLYDGDDQKTAKAYGPVATPHIFIFDKNRKLQYQGRFDDVENPSKTPVNLDAYNAIQALLQQKDVLVKTTKVFGCSIKWASKSNWLQEYKTKWAAEPVELELIDEPGIKALLQNNSDKLRIINIWATWCGPCVTEFPELVEIFRMYRGRDFEFITISADDPAKQNKVHRFLKEQQASGKNFLFNIEDKYKLIEAIDVNWQGSLPYTLIVEPGGNIYKTVAGQIDAHKLKQWIVDNKYIGRYF